MTECELPIVPDHPGALLKRRLEALNHPKETIARMLILSRQSLHSILSGKQGITPSVAIRIARLTGTSAEMWLDLQQAYDLARVRSEWRDQLLKIPALEERW